MSDSNESTVARCFDGMSPFMYARRIGSSIEDAMPHDEDGQRDRELPAIPRLSRSTTPIAVERMSVVVRFLNSRRTTGARNPPRIWEPATTAAASPAIE